MKITKELVVPNYGIEGTQGPDGKPAIYTTVTNQNIVLNAPYQGLPSDYSKAKGSIQVFEGDTEVTQQATYTLKQTLNVAAELNFNKFKVTHASTDNGMFIVTVNYKEFVSDIMITTNVVRNGQSGLDTYLHKAWSWSSDGTDRFTTKYPNENLLLGTQQILKLENSTTNNNKSILLPVNMNPKYYIGKKLKLSAYVIVKNTKPRTTVPNQTRVGVEVSFITSGGRAYHNVWKNLANGDNFEGYIESGELVIPTDYIAIGDSGAYIQANGDYLEIKYVKYEFDDTVTIYTPSPKDDFDNAWPKYEGYYSSHNPVQSTNPSDYTWSVIRGENGVGVKSTVIRYAINPQGDTPPTAGWVSQVPTLVKGQFLWTETTWTYTDNTSEKGYSVTYISKDGNNGIDGIAGKDGVGIKNTTFKYGISTSGTTKPSNWSTTIPAVPEGQFLWTETTWTYTDNTSEKGYSVAKQGVKGDTGPQGDNGQDGPPTGIIESPTIPTEVYQGMLWKNTGNLSGFITDVTYIYRGSKWEKYIFTADNIYADNLSAITANLGDVTGGSFTGSKFINSYDSRFIGDSWQRGSLRIEDGVLKDESEYYNKTTGEVTNTNSFYTLHNSLEQSSTDIKTGQHQVARFSSNGIILTDSDFSGYGSVNLTYEDLMVIEPTNLEASNNFKVYNTVGPNVPQVSRNGRLVQLYGAFSNLTQLEPSPNIKHLMTVLPYWARPKLELNFVVQGSQGNIHLLVVEPNGMVYTTRYNKGGTFIPYSVNTWCNISCNYVAGDVDRSLI